MSFLPAQNRTQCWGSYIISVKETGKSKLIEPLTMSQKILGNLEHGSGVCTIWNRYTGNIYIFEYFCSGVFFLILFLCCNSPRPSLPQKLEATKLLRFLMVHILTENTLLTCGLNQNFLLSLGKTQVFGIHRKQNEPVSLEWDTKMESTSWKLHEDTHPNWTAVSLM